jgi:hypothetical protein
MKTLTQKPIRRLAAMQRVALPLLPLLLLDIHPVSASVLEEVIVTAQKREENLQTTPMSITVIQGEALDMLGITSFDDVARATPSITFFPTRIRPTCWYCISADRVCRTPRRLRLMAMLKTRATASILVARTSRRAAWT